MRQVIRMTLDEFEAWLLGEASNFVQNWRAENKADPDEFPDSLTRDHWWHEFKAAMPFPQPPF